MIYCNNCKEKLRGKELRYANNVQGIVCLCPHCNSADIIGIKDNIGKAQIICGLVIVVSLISLFIFLFLELPIGMFISLFTAMFACVFTAIFHRLDEKKTLQEYLPTQNSEETNL